jgi:periplasmic protein TonB
MTSRNPEHEALRTRSLLHWTIVASLALHGVAYAALGAPRTAPQAAPRKTQLRFEVKHRESPKPPEPPPMPEPPAPKPPARPAAKPQPAPQPEVAPELPASSDGVTLAATGDGPGFSMPLGSGGDLTPTRVPTAPAVNVPTKVAPAPPRPRLEPPVVAVSDLSARPAPPSLGAALERNYPADARKRGSSGSAKVRARIDPDGVVRQVTLLEESAPGFGTACTRTLNGSRWGAPKDKAGRSVATEIRYTCRFVVEP